MLGLRTPLTVLRRAQTGQGSNGAAIISETVVWSGKGLIRRTSGSTKYRVLGIAAVGLYVIDMPQVEGVPIIGDVIVAGTDRYQVEWVDPASEGIQHHWEITARRAVP